jgi:hypothetical protein
MPIGQGKVSLQRKAPRRNGWTPARRAVFLDTLAQSCNATLAAREAGMQAKSARALKKRDGEFARLWGEAIEQGAERLREEVLASQLGQIPSGDNPTTVGMSPPATPFDPLTAIAVLKVHGGFGDRRVRQARPRRRRRSMPH